VVPKQPERKKNIFTKDKMLQQAMLPWHLKVLVAPGCRLKIEMEP
jgi:hypothetical protein